MLKRLNRKLSALLLIIGALMNVQGVAWAQDAEVPVATPCDEAQYMALAQLPTGKLNAYLKAGRKEDAVRTRLYYRVFDTTDCIEIGTNTASNKNYVKFGSVNLSEEATYVSVHVKLDTETVDQAGASIPQVVFSDAVNEPCDFIAGCKVKYQNQDFVLSPKKVSLTSDTAKIGVLTPYEEDIREVLYTVDGKPAYSKKVLEEFNLNYVSDGEHTIERKIVLRDGQSLTDSRVVKRGLEGGATYLFISMIYGQSRLLRYIGIALAFMIVYSVTIFIIKRVVSRRRWKSEHFFDPNEHFDLSQVGARRGITGEESYGQLLRHYKKFFIAGFSLIAGIFLINNYAMTMFTVDGVSMFPTLQDTSKHPLYTLPVTLGKVNSKYFLPPRGTIVVVQKDENNLFEAQSASEQKHYVVKRVIGLPNERVVIKNGRVLIYNKEHEKGYEPDAEYKWVKDLTGSENIVMDIKLKEGEVFVIGDNRDESIDSRFYGPVLTNQVVGKVLLL